MKNRLLVTLITLISLTTNLKSAELLSAIQNLYGANYEDSPVTIAGETAVIKVTSGIKTMTMTVCENGLVELKSFDPLRPTGEESITTKHKIAGREFLFLKSDLVMKGHFDLYQKLVKSEKLPPLLRISGVDDGEEISYKKWLVWSHIENSHHYTVRELAYDENGESNGRKKIRFQELPGKWSGNYKFEINLNDEAGSISFPFSRFKTPILADGSLPETTYFDNRLSEDLIKEIENWGFEDKGAVKYVLIQGTIY